MSHNTCQTWSVLPSTPTQKYKHT